MDRQRILVVEDETIIAKEIEHSVGQMGYDVIGIESTGEGAVERALAEKPDLVIMDIMLAGEMDGTQAAAEIRRKSHIPIVFSTAYTDQETLERVKPTAPFGYLIKPFDQMDLRITLETALYKSGMEARLRVSEARLRQAHKLEAVGTLASGIAHDFNNILSAIIGYSEMGLAKVEESDSLHKMLSRIHQAGKRAKSLVQTLLDFSRPPSLDQEAADFKPVVAEVVELAQSSLPPGVEVRLSLPDEPCLVRVDPTQLHQVVMNLVKNSCDAMREGGGELRVSLSNGDAVAAEPGDGEEMSEGMRMVGEGGGGCAILSVRDTGPGMDPDVRERVFDPFFTTKPAGEGTGMGLAVVHGLVRSYGGWISLETEPGKGSEFTVCLPRMAE